MIWRNKKLSLRLFCALLAAILLCALRLPASAQAASPAQAKIQAQIPPQIQAQPAQNWAMAGSGGAMSERALPDSGDSGGPLRLEQLKIGQGRAAGAVRIAAVFNRKPAYSLMLLENPPRLVITLPAAQFAFDAAAVEHSPLLRGFRYGSSGQNQARLIFTLPAPFQVRSASGGRQAELELAPASAAEFRHAIALQQAERTNFSLAPAAEPAAPKPFIVVVDAGHGDFDSGAIGRSGTQEKQVTLAFAKALRKALTESESGRQTPPIEAYVTRNTDSFLRLRERVEKARALQADLFVSIHADHIALPSLRGTTIYTLSDQASDAMAKSLAERENKADLADGLPADEPPEVADILLDMTRRETRAFSERFAGMAVRALRDNGIALNKNPHRYARFQVLKASDMPSVLIELGYLSNKDDEKQIADPLWQAKTAQILAGVIESYAAERRKTGQKPKSGAEAD